ncbi:hypothetical protein [Candidatus Enterococcus courvalinii]|uniref:Uncharacterized protein n=1 Tax=Candidatus Enterococcus courvalinii TaxID=2815329 RepID=A0ABS3I024_9ENTE|nr:hypothetical protein [Enterococcus sp. MSG2901]MBO0481512.1 hypothetical protein [Enterococcus sp. MSG2901]
MFKKVFLAVLSLGLLFVMFLPTQVVHGAEASLKDWRKTDIANGNVYAPAKYSVTPSYISGKTSIRTFGKTFHDTTENSNGAMNSKTVVNPVDSDKGKFGLIYDRIGMYKGQELSLKITVMDWSKYNTKNQFISFGRYSISFLQTGYNWVDLKWEFYYTATNKLASDIDGSYMNVIDIDALQGMEFDQATTNNIQKIYVTNDCWIKYKETSGKLNVYESAKKASANSDKFAQFTVLFNKGYSFRFRWTKDYKSYGTSTTTVYPSHYGANEFFGFNGKKLIPTEINKPEKYIKGSSLTDLKTSTVLGSITDNLTYELFHNVSDELPEFYFKSYEIKDTIPKGLKIVSQKVYDQADKDVTSFFDNKTSGNNIQYVAKASILKTAQFYNKTYRVEVVTKPDSTAVLNGILNSNVVTFKNKVDILVDGKAKTSDEVTTKLYKRKVTVNHIDEKDKHLLKQVIEHKFDGESYEYKPRTDLVDKEGNSYKSTVTLKGKVAGKDLVLEIPYHVPILEINVDRIQIDTSKAEPNGSLPTALNFSKKTEYEKELDKIVIKVRITDSDNKKVVYEENIKLKDYQDKKDIKLSTDYLSKDKKVNYLVDILLVENPDNNKFVTETKNLPTHGYTASEKILNNSDLKGNNVNYSAVVRTVKERKNPTVKEFNENISFEFKPTVKSKTGYGFSLSLSPIYRNETGKKATVKMYSYSDNELVDSYINEVYKSGSSQTEIKMEQTKDDSKTEAGTNTQNMMFEFPHMNVERKTGNLFTDDQKSKKDSNIKYELIDGGRTFYIPIWADLGKYTIDTKSNTFGSNLISLDMSKEADVYAYMYATIDSETSKDDELLLEPVFPDSSKPEGWSKEELNWLEN